MVGDNHTDIFIFQFSDDELDVLDGDRVYSRERFVQKDELRVDGKGAGDLATAALTSGKLDSETFPDFREVELADQALKPFLPSFFMSDISMTDMMLSSTDIFLNTEASCGR